jgi:hypothetical protein
MAARPDRHYAMVSETVPLLDVALEENNIPFDQSI